MQGYQLAELAAVLAAHREGDLGWEAARWLIRANTQETSGYQPNVTQGLDLTIKRAANTDEREHFRDRLRAANAIVAARQPRSNLPSHPRLHLHTNDEWRESLEILAAICEISVLGDCY
jgi:hypothetical protein